MYDKIRRGRPVKGYENKTHVVSIRLEPYEFEELSRVSKLTGHAKTEILRAGLHLYAAELKKNLEGKHARLF